LAYTALTIVACYALVHAVAWRLTYEDRRNPTHRMKRGEASKLWLLLLVPLAVGVVAVKTGHVDVARYCVAATLGLPFLTLTEKNWMRST
jgi:hypothetical protein